MVIKVKLTWFCTLCFYVVHALRYCKTHFVQYALAQQTTKNKIEKNKTKRDILKCCKMGNVSAQTHSGTHFALSSTLSFVCMRYKWNLENIERKRNENVLSQHKFLWFEREYHDVFNASSSAAFVKNTNNWIKRVALLFSICSCFIFCCCFILLSYTYIGTIHTSALRHHFEWRHERQFSWIFIILNEECAFLVYFCHRRYQHSTNS